VPAHGRPQNVMTAASASRLSPYHVIVVALVDAT
jgi:hypothetical protein